MEIKYNDNDDLRWAISNNPGGLEGFEESEIEEIVAEVPGANDELSWHWVVRLSDGRYALLEGWCDYTGWDCQSGLTTIGVYKTALEAAEASPSDEEYSHRLIQKNLKAQVLGEQPKFVYQED